MSKITVVSLFSGAGGLDQGFKQAGFEIIWANEYDKTIWDTYRSNHKGTKLDTRSISEIPSLDIPFSDVIIGGPPCQSWSAGGSNRGVSDKRGKLFHEYIRVVKDKQPKLLVAENVEGITRSTHKVAFNNIIKSFNDVGYTMTHKTLNASDYSVPQDRQRVFFIGIRNDLTTNFMYPLPAQHKVTLKQALHQLDPNAAHPIKRASPCNSEMNGYLDDSWSSKFMSRNRVRGVE